MIDDVRFRFDDVADVSISECDDTLVVLQIANELDSDGRFLVVLGSGTGSEREGYGGSFRARSGVVLNVIPTTGE